MNEQTKLLLDLYWEKFRTCRLDPHGRIGTAGYTAPDPESLVPLSLEEVRRGALEKVRIVGESGTGNIILAHERVNLISELTIRVTKNTNNALVVFGENLTLNGDIGLFSHDQTVILAGGIPEVGHLGYFNAQIWASGGTLFVGKGATTNGNNYVVSGENKCILVGDDCMFANGIHIATHDQHAVCDIATNKIMNHPGDVVIEPHVWLGRSVTIGKNVVVGLGSVVGAHALVVRDCPRYSMNGGVPAQVLRMGITWDRKETLRPETLERVLALGDAVTPLRNHA